MLGCGHGGVFLRIFAEMLVGEGAAMVIIDPAADNYRARRACRRAGFAAGRELDTAEGRIVLMLFQR